MSAAVLKTAARKFKVGVVSLDSPPRNALTRGVLRALAASLAEYNTDPEINAVLLHSTQKCFSVGVDPLELETWRAGLKRGESGFSSAVSAALKAFSSGKKPVVCAVNGLALGGGCELALLCDLVVAGASAVFGFPEVGLGLLPGMAGSFLLPRAVGRQRALELMLTARNITAAKAERAGLVCKIAEDELLWETALALAQRVAMRKPAAAAAIKSCVRRSELSTGAKWFEECAKFERQQFETLLSESSRIKK